MKLKSSKDPPTAHNNNKMSSASSVFATTSVLTDVSKFLDVMSTINLSMTCRSLRGSLTTCDDDDGDIAAGHYPKIRAMHFSLGDSSLFRDGPAHNPAFGVTNLATRALSRLHFPSLRTLHFRLAGGNNSKPPPLANPDEELRDTFVHLAMGLENATNLEELHLDAGLIMKYEPYNSHMIYETFARNLARGCRRLKSLKLMNHLSARGGQSYYSPRMLRALVPAVMKLGSSLEEVTLLIGNRPVAISDGVVVHPSTAASASATATAMRAGNAAAGDLFLATLRLPNLREFDLQLNLASSPLLNVFLDAAARVVRGVSPGGRRRLPSSESIEKFMVTCVLYKVPEGSASPLPSPLGLAPALALLGGECPRLRSLVVRVPPACWDADASRELGGALLAGKPKLRQLGLYFHGHECATGACLQHLLEYVREREACDENLVHVSGLECREGAGMEEEEALDGYHTKDGRKCLSHDANGMVFQAKGRVIRW